MPRNPGASLLIVQGLDPRTWTPQSRELPCMTCCHCNAVVVLNPDRKRDRHWCRKCDKYVCDKPGCIADCNPVQEGVELALRYSETQLGNQPFLGRKDGFILFDEAIRDRHRPFALGGI